MKLAFKSLSILLMGVFLLSALPAYSQIPTNVQKTESSGLEDMPFDTVPPLDDIVEKRLTLEKRVLPYQPLREADIFWEKRVWRIIDAREKMNLTFKYPPEAPLFSILMNGIDEGKIRAFEDDQFKNPLRPGEVASMISSRDTIVTFDPETYEDKIEVVFNTMDPEDVNRYRIKEVWFFDEETSTLQVRILGIAPLRNIYGDDGEFRFEKPMFWIYYPESRELLARHRVFNDYNDASPYSWEDLFEMRYFSSYIYKENDVRGRRLEDYLTGLDLLMQSEKIKEEIFNFEHDLWSY
jgi:gliding motility associated protien GldN